MSTTKFFSENLKYIMTKRCLSNSDLSRLTGLSNSFIGDVLNIGGNISLNKADKIAQSLHIDLWVMALPPRYATKLMNAGHFRVSEEAINMALSGVPEEGDSLQDDEAAPD